MQQKPPISAALGTSSLIGLGLGIGVGILGQYSVSGPITVLARALAPIGDVWISALQMIVIPLVLTQLLAALVRPGEAGHMGRVGAQTIATILGLLVGFGVLALLLVPHLLDFFTFPPSFGEAIGRLDSPDSLIESSSSESGGISGWLVGLIPRNIFEAASQGDLIQLLVFTLLLGMAAGKLPGERRDPLAEVFRSLSDAMLMLVGWVLWVTPFGVFAVMLRFSLEAGTGVVGVSLLFVALLCGTLLLATVFLYPMTVVLGRVPFRVFAKAVLPAQIIAIGTQSSLATLPALVEEGRRKLGLSGEATGFVLPFCASVFKLNLVVSQTFILLFFAAVFGIPVGWGTGLRFLLGIILISVSYPGLPRGAGSFRSLPLHLAAGIPLEAIVLYEAIKTIPDVFFTLLNSTSYMSVAAITSWKAPGRGAHTNQVAQERADPAERTERKAR